MNFMSGRSGGFCDEIITTASPSILRTSSSSSPTFHFREIPAGDVAAVDDGDEGGGSGSSSSRGASAVIEREHMFDKVVTPSDVGKLNRLVIPKQHAEKYFPLDSSSNEKGLLLNFEDRTGKPWRFRYSYWNSSQSYVMTKGWSRFVKEKKLDAGDIVSFQRGVGDSAKDRLFIDWRHRPDVPDIPPSLTIPGAQFSFHRSSIHPWSPLFLPPPPPPLPPSSRDYSHFLHPAAAIPTPNHHYHHHAIGNYASNYGNPNYSPAASIMYLRSTPGASGHFASQQFGAIGATTAARGSRTVEQLVFNAVPVVQGKAAAKRLRLFGVNMDCPIPDESSDDGCDIVLSSSTTTTHPPPPTISPSPFDNYSSPSSSTTPRLHLPTTHHTDDDDNNKGKAASMSLDLDI